jgi:hypothetical protein
VGKSKLVERQSEVLRMQDRVRFVLKRLGLWEALKGTRLADHLLRCHNSRITATLAEECPRTEETDRILRTLRNAIDQTTVGCPPFGRSFPATDVEPAARLR